MTEQKLGRGNQKAVYSSLGNILEKAENKLDQEFDVATATVAIKAAQEMTRAFLAEVILSREQRETETHRAVVRGSTAKVRNIENKIFDQLPE